MFFCLSTGCDGNEVAAHVREFVLNFRVPKAFHKEFSMFTIQHDYRSQADVLYEAFEALKEKREGTH